MIIKVGENEHDIPDEVVNALKEIQSKEVKNEAHQAARAQTWETAKQDVLAAFKGIISEEKLKDENLKFKDILQDLSKKAKEIEATKNKNTETEDILKDQLKTQIESEFNEKLKEKELTFKMMSIQSELTSKAIANGLKDEYHDLFNDFVSKKYDIQFNEKGELLFRDKSTDTFYYEEGKPATTTHIVKKILDTYKDIKSSPKSGTFGLNGGEMSNEDINKLPLERRMELNLGKLGIFN